MAVILFQKPNAPIYVAVGWYLLRFLPLPHASVLSFWGVSLTMCYWAGWEIATGVNLWRRILGLIVLGYVGYGMLVAGNS